MKKDQFDSLISSILKIDGLKNEYQISNAVEKEAIQLIKADFVHFYFYNEEKKSLYRQTEVGNYEIFQNELGLLSEIVFHQTGGFFDDEWRLRNLENCEAKEKTCVKNIYASIVSDFNKVYGLLVAFNTEKNHPKHKDFEQFSRILMLLLRKHGVLKHSVTKAKEHSSVTLLSQFLLLHHTSVMAFFDKVLEVVCEDLKSSRVSIILKKENSKHFYFANGKAIAEKILLDGVVTVSHNVLGFVFENKRGVLCEDIERDERFGKKKTLRYRTNSFISVPILSSEQVIGFLSVSEHLSNETFNDNDFSYLTSIAHTLSQGISFLRSKGLFLEQKGVRKNFLGSFSSQYQDWLDHQDDFFFSEEGLFSKNEFPIFALKQTKKPNRYSILLSRLVGKDSLVIVYRNHFKSFLLSDNVFNDLNSIKESFLAVKKEFDNVVLEEDKKTII